MWNQRPGWWRSPSYYPMDVHRKKKLCELGSLKKVYDSWHYIYIYVFIYLFIYLFIYIFIYLFIYIYTYCIQLILISTRSNRNKSPWTNSMEKSRTIHHLFYKSDHIDQCPYGPYPVEKSGNHPPEVTVNVKWPCFSGNGQREHRKRDGAPQLNVCCLKRNM